MQLQAALGFSLMFTKGMISETHAALSRAVELAENLDDPDYQLRSLFGLCAFRIRLADCRGALELARQCEAVADRVSDPGARATADWTLGVSLFYAGNIAGAQTHLLRVRDGHRSASRRAEAVRFGFDRRIHALGILGMIRWLQGFPDRAYKRVGALSTRRRRWNMRSRYASQPGPEASSHYGWGIWRPPSD